MIYDVSLQTGNRALDVVLMEKGLFCKIMKSSGPAWWMEAG